MAAKFGTSGLRGLATELTDGTARRYARAFARHLQDRTLAAPGTRVLVGADLRASSPLITSQVLDGLEAEGLAPVDCGALPTPALASAGMSQGLASVMVTGSHIPAERNGLKFYRADGEISKSDEDDIARHAATIPTTDAGAGTVNAESCRGLGEDFISRIITCLPNRPLDGRRIGIYEHSTVARDLLASMIGQLGATAVSLGRSDTFIALDTEAVDAGICDQLALWAQDYGLDAIVSADGDGDRPLVTDATGKPLRGDAIGLLTALFVDAAAIVTPITSNSGIEARFGKFVLRTRVGSPYVIAGIAAARQVGHARIGGFEANGGFLLADDTRLGNGVLSALPTRDSFLPIAAVLCLAARTEKSVAALIGDLALPATDATKIEQLPEAALRHLLASLQDDRALTTFLLPLGSVADIDKTDGLRARLTNDEVVFIRPSGNEPALRCYVEAAGEARARQLLAALVELVEQRLR